LRSKLDILGDGALGLLLGRHVGGFETGRVRERKIKT
jgi:hypothetical protein